MDNWMDSPYRKLQLDISDIDAALPVLHALSSELRLKILKELWKGGCSVNELARVLNVPVSTAALNIQILERAGLIVTEMKPGTRGLVKLCTQRVSSVSLNMEQKENSGRRTRKFEMPVGCYSVVSGVEPSCGLAGYDRNFAMDDMLGAFYHPQRFEAELLWMHAGTVEYRFPAMRERRIDFLEISYEACSETRTYRNDYPSDIFTEVNGVRVKSSNAMVAQVDKCEAGEAVTMKVYRYNYDAEGNLTGGFEVLEITLKLQMLD
jgi:predicted transcriptional regulator